MKLCYLILNYHTEIEDGVVGLPLWQLREKERQEREEREEKSLQIPHVHRPKREQGVRVRINVCGKIFETYHGTLTSKPGSIFNLPQVIIIYLANERYFSTLQQGFERIRGAKIKGNKVK